MPTSVEIAFLERLGIGAEFYTRSPSAIVRDAVIFDRYGRCICTLANLAMSDLIFLAEAMEQDMALIVVEHQRLPQSFQRRRGTQVSVQMLADLAELFIKRSLGQTILFEFSPETPRSTRSTLEALTDLDSLSDMLSGRSRPGLVNFGDLMIRNLDNRDEVLRILTRW
jgi:hypothetical protein